MMFYGEPAYGYAPSLREIMAAVGLRSLSAVAYELDRLVALERIWRAPGKARAIRVL